MNSLRRHNDARWPMIGLALVVVLGLAAIKWSGALVAQNATDAPVRMICVQPVFVEADQPQNMVPVFDSGQVRYVRQAPGGGPLELGAASGDVGYYVPVPGVLCVVRDGATEGSRNGP